MRFSWWIQKWDHSEIVIGGRNKILENLLDYYQNSSRSFSLIHQDDNCFTFSRGWKWFSVLSLGPETWLFHIIKVSIDNIKDDTVQLCWNIDLKLCGLQIGKNAIIEECKQLTKSSTGL